MSTSAAMPTARVTDLSFSIERHFRWRPQLELVESLDEGDAFSTSRFAMSCHGFTHADAPAHVISAGATVEQVDVRQWVGEAAVVDLTTCAAEHPITGAELEASGSHVRRGDIVLLRTDWDTRADISSSDYWSTAPHVTRSAAQWLLDKDVSCVGFDFPQDHAIRRAVAGERPAPHEFVTHDVLLRNGVGLLEYLCNLHRLTRDRVFLVAPPIKLAGADGGPARVIALEFD